MYTLAALDESLPDSSTQDGGGGEPSAATIAGETAAAAEVDSAGGSSATVASAVVGDADPVGGQTGTDGDASSSVAGADSAATPCLLYTSPSPRDRG